MSAHRLVALAALLWCAPARAADADTLLEAWQQGWPEARIVRLIVRQTWTLDDEDWVRLRAAGVSEGLLRSLDARILAQADTVPDESGPAPDPIPHTPLPRAVAVSAAVLTAVGLSVALQQVHR